MNKKYIFSIGVATAALMMGGCGGGDSSSASIDTGTGYYVDSAVEGVHYDCGSLSGTTDINGAFRFEKGRNCAFSIAGIRLKEVNASELVDDKIIVENDVKIAQVLQTLDVDGNPDNGITITPEVINTVAEVLKDENGNPKLPDTEEKLEILSETLSQKVADYQGHAVSAEEAELHLEKTRKNVQEEELKALLAGKTVYAVGHEINGTDLWYGKVTFNDDLSSLHYTELGGEDAGSEEDYTITLDGNKIIWNEDNSYTIVGENKGNYIEVDYKANGALDSHTRLYFNKTKAEAYFNSIKGGDAAKSLQDLIVGKTYYVTADGEDVETPHVETLHFGEDGETLTDTWEENGETKQGTFHYSIDGDMLEIQGKEEDGTPFDLKFSNVKVLDDGIVFENVKGDVEVGELYYTYDAAAKALPHKIIYSGFTGEAMKDGHCTASAEDIVLVGSNGTLNGWHDQDNYPLQMLIVLDKDGKHLECFSYDFHKYNDEGNMGSGQSGTDGGITDYVVSSSNFNLKGSYNTEFKGSMDSNYLYSGQWEEKPTENNFNYSGSGTFSIQLKRLR